MTPNTTAHPITRGTILEIVHTLSCLQMGRQPAPHAIRDALLALQDVLIGPSLDVTAMQRRLATLVEQCDAETLALDDARQRLERYVELYGELSPVLLTKAPPPLCEAAPTDEPLETGEGDAISIAAFDLGSFSIAGSRTGATA